jgi:hypothetical protein
MVKPQFGFVLEYARPTFVLGSSILVAMTAAVGERSVLRSAARWRTLWMTR